MIHNNTFVIKGNPEESSILDNRKQTFEAIPHRKYSAFNKVRTLNRINLFL
jgi:hypothetical protein